MKLKKTTTEVITDRVILEAKRMLMDKKMTVNEIAVQLGYDDYSIKRFFQETHCNDSYSFRVSK
jgi:AraC-like DNA-binding protein